MNRIWKTGIAAMLLLALVSAGCLAEGERKGLFAFINAYTTPVTQPHLTPKQQEDLVAHPGVSMETTYATYTVTDAAFDGKTLYVLVDAVPKRDVLLLSAYAVGAEDPIWYEDGESGGESFAQRAAREGKKMVVSGLFSCNTVEEMSFEGESYCEAFYQNGTMQLYGCIPLKEAAPVFDGKLRIREAIYGEELTDTELTLRVEPTAKLETGVWMGEAAAGPLSVTKVVVNRSEISASLWIYTHVQDALSAKEAEILCAMEAITPDVQAFSGGFFVMDAQGELQWRDPTGGDDILFVSRVAAGDALPVQLKCVIRNYALGKALGAFTIPIAAD